MSQGKSADFTTGASCPTPSNQAAKPSQAEGELRGSEPNVQRAGDSGLSGGSSGEVGGVHRSTGSVGATRSNFGGSTVAGSYTSGAESMSNESVARQASEAGREVKDAAKEVAGAAKRQVSETAAHARDAIGMQTAKLQEQGAQFLVRQKDYCAEEVCHVGSAVRQAAQKLHEEGDARLATYIDQAADGIEGVGSYLRDRDSTELVGDFERFARRRPEIVYGGLFLAGLGIARFLKASSSRHRMSENYGSSSEGGWDEDAGEMPETYRSASGAYDPYAATASYMASAVTARYPEDGDKCDVV